MTDKQIIIDGCDVSGCEFYNKVIGEDAYCNIDEEHLCTCISYDNCYYKQLKRKEQECEEFKQKLLDKTYAYSVMERSRRNSLQQLDQLEAELHRANCQIADDEILQCDMRETIEELKAENERLIECLGVANKYANKYHATLQDIKEIAKYELNNLTESAINGGRYVEILEKINEVIDE